MNHEVVILMVEDDEGHARLAEKNLRRAGINNEFLRFKDGQEVLDFLFQETEGQNREMNGAYLVLLDIRLPKIDGIEVLRRIKQDEELRKIPIIMLTTMDDPREVDACHRLGCSHYIVKPVEYDRFADTLRQLGLFFNIVQIPQINLAQ